MVSKVGCKQVNLGETSSRTVKPSEGLAARSDTDWSDLSGNQQQRLMCLFDETIKYLLFQHSLEETNSFGL